MSAITSVQNPSPNFIAGRQYRNRARGVNYAQPRRPVPRIASSSESPRIEDETLALLARQIAKTDAIVLDLTVEAFRVMAEQDADLWSSLEEVDYQQEIVTAQVARRQILEIQGGRLAFGRQYLSDEAMILFWDRAISVLMVLCRTGVQGNEGNLAVALRNAAPLFASASRLPDLIMKADAAKLLKPEHAATIRERLLKLEDLWDSVQIPLTEQGLEFTPWHDLRDRMDEARRQGSGGVVARHNPSLVTLSGFFSLFPIRKNDII
ncbi:hypothetical protein NW759_012457 [Fusarium solani]|nr:hypothetical protein NW759_012457 [Fusarium solani]